MVIILTRYFFFTKRTVYTYYLSISTYMYYYIIIWKLYVGVLKVFFLLKMSNKTKKFLNLLLVYDTFFSRAFLYGGLYY